MASTIQLRQGDMFARPADLIIIPCSTAGTITSLVAKQLEAFDIQPPRGHMNLGDVKFQLFEGASNIATYVGYAASVRAMTSDVEAIERIATKIADFVAEKSEIRDVAIPLLGSGAGRLTAERSANALQKGLKRAPVEEKVFNIFVYERADFNNLTRLFKNTSREDTLGRAEQNREPIRVFISYTRTNVEHQEWIKEIARFLREHGIDARLDVWHLRPGMDLPQWMCNEIDLADRILIICNEEYALKANGRRGGVGWEIRLIQGDLLQTQSSNPKKYIPIMRERFSEQALPNFLRGVYAFNWIEYKSDGHAKDQLLREIYEVFEEAPDIGQPPRYVLSRTRSSET